MKNNKLNLKYHNLIGVDVGGTFTDLIYVDWKTTMVNVRYLPGQITAVQNVSFGHFIQNYYACEHHNHGF